MSDAKAKALARQQRILAKSQARMAVAKGEASALSDEPVVVPDTPPAAGQPAPVQPQQPQAQPEPDVSAHSAPTDGTDHNTAATSKGNEVDHAAAVAVHVAEETAAQAESGPPKEKRSAGRVLASRREKIQARQAAVSAAPSPADPDDALLEDAMNECMGEKGESKAATPSPKPKPVAAHAPEDDSVPTIAEHATAVNDKEVMKLSKPKGRGFIRLSKATIVHLVNFAVVLSIACMNGYYADVRALRWTTVDTAADPHLQELKAFVQASAVGGSGTMERTFDEFTDPEGAAFDQYSLRNTWSQSIYSFLRNFAACLFENSFLCVLVVHCFIVPKIMPLVEHVLLLFGIVDSDMFSASPASSGGASLVSWALSLFMGGVSGLIASVLDVFSYVALHCVFSIGFSVLFAHCFRGLAAEMDFVSDDRGISAGGDEL